MRLITRDRCRDLWIFFGFALLVIGSGLGLREPWPADEPRFALVARQMVDSGDWLFPHRGDELYSDKPPLYMWLQAASYIVLGDWKIAFLLPALLSAMGTLWLTYDMGRRLRGHRIGMYGAYTLLFCIQFAWQFKKAQIDPALVFFVTLANWGLLNHFLVAQDTRRLYLGWFAAGLGTITKGVGVIALLMGLPYLYARWQGWRGLSTTVRSHAWFAAPLLFAGAAAMWLVPMLLAVYLSDDPALRAYADDILFRQTAERYATSWDHHQPPWYFIEVVSLMWMPAMLALPWALPAWWRRLRRRDARTLLPLAWTVLVLIFFSIPDGKRDLYVLPALPMFCLALAPLVPGIVRRGRFRLALCAFVLLLGAVPLLAGTWALLGDPPFKVKLITDRGFAPDFNAPWWMLAVTGAAVMIVMLACRTKHVLLGTLAALTTLWCMLGFWAYPILDASSSGKALMTETGRRLAPSDELAIVAWSEQYLLQADRPTATFGYKVPWPQQVDAALRWMAAAPERRHVLIQDAALGDCFDMTARTPVGSANRRTWWLVRFDDVSPQCREEKITR